MSPLDVPVGIALVAVALWIGLSLARAAGRRMPPPAAPFCRCSHERYTNHPADEEEVGR